MIHFVLEQMIQGCLGKLELTKIHAIHIANWLSLVPNQQRKQDPIAVAIGPLAMLITITISFTLLCVDGMITMYWHDYYVLHYYVDGMILLICYWHESCYFAIWHELCIICNV